ncbi:MAG: hypothetical protein ACOCRX_01545 [Candidatus Woesearchaeota archaeon]
MINSTNPKLEKGGSSNLKDSKRIGIKIDGVLRNLNEGFNRIYERKELDLDELINKFSHNFLKDISEDLFLNSNPYEKIGFLYDISKNNEVIYFSSNQYLLDVENYKEFTYQWFDKYEIMYDKILFNPDKSDLNLDILLNDFIDSEYMNNYNLVIMDRPYNRVNNGLSRVYDLEDFYVKLRENKI